MSTKDKMVGQNIIDGRSGIGEIIDVVELNEGGGDYYKVVFPKDRCTNYFPTKNSSSYRILSSEATMKKAIKVFNTKHDEIDYSTTQEKVVRQKEMLKETDIIKLAKYLSVINSEEEVHALIRKSFKDTLKTFVDELMFVMGLKRSEAHALLNIKDSSKKQKK